MKVVGVRILQKGVVIYMKKFGKVVVKLRIPILVLSFLLLIPAALGYLNTKVNYDILYYLPSDIDTMQGQDILLDDFGKGAYAMVVVDGMNKSNVSKLVKKVEGVDLQKFFLISSGLILKMRIQELHCLQYSLMVQHQVMTQ